MRLRLPGMDRALALREVRSILRYRKLAAFHRLSGRASPKLRDRALRPPLALVERLAERDPGHAVWGPTTVLLRWEVGRTQDALDLLDRGLAVAEPTALLRLALVAVAVGRLDATRPIVDRLPEGPLRRRLLAELALASGRYRETIELAGGLTGSADRGRRLQLVGRAEAELRVLDPAWRPALPPRAAPRLDAGARAACSISSPTRSPTARTATPSGPSRSPSPSAPSGSTRTSRRGRASRSRRAAPARRPVSAWRACPTTGSARTCRSPGAPDVLATETAAGLDALVAELRPARPPPDDQPPQRPGRPRPPRALPAAGRLRGPRLPRGDLGLADGRRRRHRRPLRRGASRGDRVHGRRRRGRHALRDDEGRHRGPRDPARDGWSSCPTRSIPRGSRRALATRLSSRRLGFERGETVLGYVSSMVAYEGIGYLIEATRILRDRGRRVRLLLVGDGEERGALEDRARALGLLDDGVARFAGRVPHGDVGAYYSLIDLFVVPRTNDRVSQLVTPLKPYEAMAMERCLVVSGVGALLEIVQDGETGTLVRARGPGLARRRRGAAAGRARGARPARRERPGLGPGEPDVGAERRALPRALRAARRGLKPPRRGLTPPGALRSAASTADGCYLSSP